MSNLRSFDACNMLDTIQSYHAQGFKKTIHVKIDLVIVSYDVLNQYCY